MDCYSRGIHWLERNILKTVFEVLGTQNVSIETFAKKNIQALIDVGAIYTKIQAKLTICLGYVGANNGISACEWLPAEHVY